MTVSTHLCDKLWAITNNADQSSSVDLFTGEGELRLELDELRAKRLIAFIAKNKPFWLESALSKRLP